MRIREITLFVAQGPTGSHEIASGARRTLVEVEVPDDGFAAVVVTEPR